MATLTLVVSNLSASVNATDANATKILLNVFDAQYQLDNDPTPVTNEQKLNWVVSKWIVPQLVAVAREYEAKKLRADAAANEAATVGAIKFG